MPIPLHSLTLVARVFRSAAWVVAIEGVLALVAVLCVSLWPLPDATRFVPYAVFAVGLLMSWRFRRSRLLFGLLVLGFADRALVLLGSQPPEYRGGAASRPVLGSVRGSRLR